MSESVRPVNGKTNYEKASSVKPMNEESTKVNIGGVTFDKNQIDEDKTRSYMKDGRKINSVFIKPGVRIDFPDQTDTNKTPVVESIGLRNEWYNPDESNIHITDLENAKIYGDPNKSDYIGLHGASAGNEIFVDKKESLFVNGNMRKDYVDLGPNTENNTVHMDEKDETTIWYNQVGVETNGETVQGDIGNVQVEGEGISEQELQLQDSLTKEKYQDHKRLQK